MLLLLVHPRPLQLEQTQRHTIDRLLGIWGTGSPALIRRDLGLDDVRTLYIKECARLLRRLYSDECQHTLAAQMATNGAIDLFVRHKVLIRLREKVTGHGLDLKVVLNSALGKEEFKDYLDQKCAKRTWEQICTPPTPSDTDPDPLLPSAVQLYIRTCKAANTAQPCQMMSSYLVQGSFTNRLLAHAGNVRQLLMLRTGCSTLRVHTDKLTPYAERLCQQCTRRHLDDPAHLFFSCVRTQHSRIFSIAEMKKTEIYSQWESLHTDQQMAIFLLEATPQTLGLVVDGHQLQSILRPWRTQALQALE